MSAQLYLFFFFDVVDGFLSSWRCAHLQEFVPKLNLQEGEHVLDAGSGLGGSAFFMAEVCNVFRSIFFFRFVSNHLVYSPSGERKGSRLCSLCNIVLVLYCLFFLDLVFFVGSELRR